MFVVIMLFRFIFLAPKDQENEMEVSEKSSWQMIFLFKARGSNVLVGAFIPLVYWHNNLILSSIDYYVRHEIEFVANKYL
jgi:hypothetical protein